MKANIFQTYIKSKTWSHLFSSHSITPLRCYNGSRTLRPQDTSAPQNRCRSLSRITGGAVSHRNCPGLKCPGFSSITALVSKCLVGLPRFRCQSVLRPVPKCPRVSWCRSVLWPKCPVTVTIHSLRSSTTVDNNYFIFWNRYFTSDL